MAEVSDTYRRLTIDDFRPGIHSDYHGQAGQPTDATGGYSGWKLQQELRSADLVTGYRASPSFPMAATIQNTFRCVADPVSGSLGPLPKLSLIKSRPMMPDGNVNVGSTFYPSDRQANYLLDACMAGPRAVSTGYVNLTDPADTYTLYEYFWSFNHTGVPATGAGYNTYYHGVLDENWRATTIHYCFSKILGISAAYILFSGGIEQSRTMVVTVPGSPATIPSWRNQMPIVVTGYGYNGLANFESGALNATELAASGVTYDTDMANGANFTAPGASGKGYTLVAHPRPTAVRVAGKRDVFEAIVTDADATYWPAINTVVSHQGRIMGVLHAYTYNAALDQEGMKDILYYFPVLDFMANDAGTTWSGRTAFTLDIGEETVSPIGIVASLSADELLVIKYQQGGYAIRGDIDNPTVQRLPFLEPTAGVASTGTITPIGFVYGTRNGVFVYTGGDSTPKLSTQLEGFFWDHLDHVAVNFPELYQGFRARFGYMYPWVAVPNNYLYDTRSESWWRLEKPDPVNGPIAFSHYTAHPTNDKLRCYPYKITPTRNEAYYDIDPTVLASSYSWQSHAIYETRDRIVSVQDILLTASIPGGAVGTQTVTVTLTGTDSNGVPITPVATLFALNPASTAPQQIQTAVVANFEAMNVQVLITAQDSGTAPAPKVHSVGFGIVDRARIPVVSAASKYFVWDMSTWDGGDVWY